MLKPTHINIGGTISLVSILYTGVIYYPVLIFPLLSLLPDLDSHTSYVNKKLKISFLTKKLKHRGFLHSLFFSSIFGSSLYLFLQNLIGYNFSYEGLITFILISSSHIVADFFTKQGVPLLYPLTNENFGIPLISTGKSGEKIINFLTSGVNVVLITYLFLHLKDVGFEDSGNNNKIYLIGGSLLTMIYFLWEDIKNAFKKGKKVFRFFVDLLVKGVFVILFSTGLLFLIKNTSIVEYIQSLVSFNINNNYLVYGAIGVPFLALFIYFIKKSLSISFLLSELVSINILFFYYLIYFS